jgi:hypothetical protein
MNKRDFAINESAYKDLVGSADCARGLEYVPAERMRPPTSMNQAAGNGFGKRRYGTVSRLKNDAMFLYKSDGLLWRHDDLSVQSYARGNRRKDRVARFASG